MKKIVLTYGLISGSVFTVFLFAMIPFGEQIGFGAGSYVLGYTVMFLAFLLIFFGVRSYRENVGNGAVSFGRALGVGLLIMLISCLMYVITWEIVFYNFVPGFADKYAAVMMEQMKAEGAAAAEIEQATSMMKLYRDNVLFNSLITFTEPLPVGLLVSLLSAAVLKKKPAAS